MELFFDPFISILGFVALSLSSESLMFVTKLENYDYKKSVVTIYYIFLLVSIIYLSKRIESVQILLFVQALILFVCADIDIKYHEISDIFMTISIANGLIYLLMLPQITTIHIISMGIAMFPFIFGGLFSMMGMGDLKIMIGTMMFIDTFEKATLFLIISFSSAVIYSLLSKLVRYEHKVIAFIPHISTGFLCLLIMSIR